MRHALLAALGPALLLSAPAHADTGTLIADRWYAEPLLYPQLGYESYQGDQGTLSYQTIGLGVGELFHDTQGGLLSAKARVEGALWSGSDGVGFEVRGGPFWTPRMKWWGAEIGVDPFYNRFTAPAFVLPPTFGVGLPVTAYLGPRQAFLIAGVTPAWVPNPERRVDWDRVSAPVPVGHESEWRLGFGLTLGRFSVTMVYTQRTTILGTGSGFGVGFSQAPYVPPDDDEGPDKKKGD